MPRRRVGDREEAVNQFAREVEAEYDVVLSWEYSARGEMNGRPRALATATAYPLAWSELPLGRWAASGEIVQTSTGSRELKAHLELISRLMVDLQIARAYGVAECEHFIPLPK